MDVEMENVAESAEVPELRALVEIPQQQEKSSRREEEIVERSWFPCGSWTPADWTTSFFSCGSAVFKADSFEYVSDSLCDGFDVPNPCSMYLENKPHNKPCTTFDSANTKPSIVQSNSSYNFEDVEMEDRFMGGYSSLPSVAEKSHRSGPESSSEHTTSDMFDLSERKPPRNPQYPVGNVNNEDIRHHTIQLSPIKWKTITNNSDHQKTNSKHAFKGAGIQTIHLLNGKSSIPADVPLYTKRDSPLPMTLQRLNQTYQHAALPRPRLLA
jgi:hypothetical protein